MAFGQTGQQRGLRSVHAFQGFGQITCLRGGEGDGLVATLIAEDFSGLGHEVGSRVEQRLCVEDFQPVALAVLGANTKGDAEEGGAHLKGSLQRNRVRVIRPARLGRYPV